MERAHCSSLWNALIVAALIVSVLIGLNAMGVRRLWPYLLGGIALWYFVHESGVHATVAGVALAFTIPTHTRINAVEFSRKTRDLLARFDRTESGDSLVLTSKGQQEAVFAIEHASKAVTAPILRLENVLHSFSAFVVMPLFAFANAGVRIGGPFRHAEVAIGVLLGLVIGLLLEYCSGLLLGNRSASRRPHLARSNPESVSFPAVLGGRHCSVTPAWQGSVLPCRCLSLCLRSMRLGQLTRQSQVFSPGRFWPGSRARLF